MLLWLDKQPLYYSKNKIKRKVQQQIYWGKTPDTPAAASEPPSGYGDTPTCTFCIYYIKPHKKVKVEKGLFIIFFTT